MLLIGVEFRVEEIISFQSDRVQNRFILSRLEILVAEVFHFRNGLEDQFNFDVSLIFEILLNLFLSFIIEIVLDAEVSADLFVLFVDVHWQ